ALERRDDLATREDLDLEPTATRFLDDLRQPERRALQQVVRWSPRCRHPPLDLRLGDDVRGVGDRGRRDPPCPTARLREEVAPSGHGILLARVRTRRNKRGVYWITWSARSSTDCGIVSPSALRSFQIDYQFELGGLLDGQVAGAWHL